jgi:hypothetical protein
MKNCDAQQTRCPSVPLFFNIGSPFCRMGHTGVLNAIKFLTFFVPGQEILDRFWSCRNDFMTQLFTGPDCVFNIAMPDLDVNYNQDDQKNTDPEKPGNGKIDQGVFPSLISSLKTPLTRSSWAI